MKILFVCTGNTCRSPMAEAFARQYLKDKSITDITVSSCGLYPQVGQPTSGHACTVMSELGLDISCQKSRRIDPTDITDSDLIIVMSPSHMALLSQTGVPMSRIMLLSGGVSDPYGGDVETYRICRDQIKEAVFALLDRLTAVKSDE